MLESFCLSLTQEECEAYAAKMRRLRSLLLSYQKKDWEANPSFGMTPTVKHNL